MPAVMHGHVLAALGVLRVRGADSVRFLQGQLSQDISLVSPSRSALAGYHNPQGRVIALMRLVALGENDLIALLPRELVATVAARLAKFVLRSRVTLADESGLWAVIGLSNRDEATTHLPLEPNAQIANGEGRYVCVDTAPGRWLSIKPRGPLPMNPDPASEQAWQALDIAAGQPQVYAATSEVFVSQMLNLDLIGAIAFDKGCYTGQEIIARAHYRGRMKRRMQRFRAAAGTALQPGDRGVLADGREYQVVRSAEALDATEFLAVCVLPPDESKTNSQLPLPYSLPV
jgi:tRNA-modifying protein YgfZ